MANWAITIGVNRYRYLQPLQFAVRDAGSVQAFFTSELGFEQVYHFTENAPPIPQDYGPPLDSTPTVTTLKRFLRERFKAPFLREGDNLWFFFAGHGIREQNRDYLMPLDGDRADLAGSAVSLHYVSECLRRSGADNVILLIDACRSDDGRRDGLGIGQEKQQGVITLFSCSPYESSYEIQELQQGAFTHVLLDSLRIQGEGNCATVERLYQRLRHRVPLVTRQYRQEQQTPYGVIEPPSKNHLILLTRQATLADVETLKKDALMAEVRRDFKGARELWVRVLAVSPADPEAIDGIERLRDARMASQPRTTSTSPSSSRTEAATPRSVAVSKKSPKIVKSVTGHTKVSVPKQRIRSIPKQTVKSRSSIFRFQGSANRVSRRQALWTIGLLSVGSGAIRLSQKLYHVATNRSKPLPIAPALTVEDFISVRFDVVTVNEQGETLTNESHETRVFR